MEIIPPPSNIPKRSWLKQELESLISAGRSGDQLPTYAEMLQRYQVGQGTIDYVVLQLAAEGKIERRKGAGLFITSLAKQRSIGLIYEWDTRKAGESLFERRLIEKIRERVHAQNQHYAFYLHVPFEEDQLAADRANLVNDVEAGRLEGLILIGGDSEPLMQLLSSKNVPHVLFSTFSNHINQVGIDFTNLIEQGVNALAYSGSKRIGLISTHGGIRLRTPDFREDLDAFQAALTRNRLELIPEALIEHKSDVSSVPPSLRETNMEIGYWAATSLFQDGNRLGLDGLVVMDDYYTQGVLLAFEDLGLRVQQDVRIATHAIRDCTPLKYRANKMILLETDPEAVVDALFRVLEKWTIQGIKPNHSHRLPVTLRLPMHA